MSIGIHVIGFSFPFVLLIGSVCEAYRLSCFRAQVNMPYRIVSCHSTVFTVHTRTLSRTLSLTLSKPHPRSAAREGIRSDLIHGSLVSTSPDLKQHLDLFIRFAYSSPMWTTDKQTERRTDRFYAT